MWRLEQCIRVPSCGFAQTSSTRNDGSAARAKFTRTRKFSDTRPASLSKPESVLATKTVTGDIPCCATDRRLCPSRWAQGIASAEALRGTKCVSSSLSRVRHHQGRTGEGLRDVPDRATRWSSNQAQHRGLSRWGGMGMGRIMINGGVGPRLASCMIGPARLDFDLIVQHF
ncbi:hypothetical protein M427DRAFT_341035 [Gonapodya prolifera JEL478]|uniref:Uncharacterized protein n=1 Tax=Gonapodya prolifera (strain JEL478) TaxID=1344416 RepID=A0A139ACI2_GONPJ|nr:hypothetical protein M427DRAFT_341035 [Gonapodya prolifera JEL478]|eukprot:KXS14379.1 hypothetical protein M427DRAFT_341035 [Gonapodya prolifera JEL478]